MPGRFEDWADLKAAYRFFSNPKITHKILQEPHYHNALEKARFSEETVLFIQDGSEFLFSSHPWTHGLGPTADSNDSNGNGLMFHSYLVAKYHESEETEVWLRSLNKMGHPQKNWVSVGDRANDIYDFLRGADESGWKYAVRARHNRQVGIDGEKNRLFTWTRQQTAKCTTKLFVKKQGEEFSKEAALEITWNKAKLFAPGNKCSVSGEEATYIRVWCPEKPKLEWLLITNLPVNDAKDALRVVKIYRRRWLIEDYHKALKNRFSY